MKHILTIPILLFSFISFGQVEKDSTVIQYIEAQDEFVSLSDSSKVPDSIKPYLSVIKDYMANHEEDIHDYWIWTSYIQDNSSLISIPMCHYDGFVFKKSLEEKNKEANKDRKEGEPMIIIDFTGNPSGKDGTLEIDKSAHAVLRFGLWQ